MKRWLVLDLLSLTVGLAGLIILVFTHLWTVGLLAVVAAMGLLYISTTRRDRPRP
jgi:hypothetical protein